MTAEEYLTQPWMFGCIVWKLTLSEKACLIAQQRFDMGELACWGCSYGEYLRGKHGVRGQGAYGNLAA